MKKTIQSFNLLFIIIQSRRQSLQSGQISLLLLTMSEISSQSSELTTHGDCRDDLLHSKAAKQGNAITHFNHFLKTYCKQIGIDVVEADAIPYRGIPRKSSNKAVSEFWGKLIGSFFAYMGTDARHR